MRAGSEKSVLTISSLKLLNVSNGALLGASGLALAVLGALFIRSALRSRGRDREPLPEGVLAP